MNTPAHPARKMLAETAKVMPGAPDLSFSDP